MRDSTFISADPVSVSTVADVQRRAVGSPVALAPGRLVPQAGGDLRVVPRTRVGAAVFDLGKTIVHLGALARVVEAPVAQSDTRIAKVQPVVGEGSCITVVAVAPLYHVITISQLVSSEKSNGRLPFLEHPKAYIIGLLVKVIFVVFALDHPLPIVIARMSHILAL